MANTDEEGRQGKGKHNTDMEGGRAIAEQVIPINLIQPLPSCQREVKSPPAAFQKVTEIRTAARLPKAATQGPGMQGERAAALDMQF